MVNLRLGMVGVSEGNGHPYSFASIVNGYSESGFAASEWGVIHDYLREKDPSEFGFEGVAVTHAWTQDAAETERLCAAARIPNAAADLDSLADRVDAVIVARDDHERHADLALPLLERGLPVFVDKPLTLDEDDLAAFSPHLESGRLTSASGMRFARELDEPRAHPERYGAFRLVRGTVINDWPRYGVHVLDAVYGLLDQRPVAVEAVAAPHDSVTVEMDGGTHVQVDALGDVATAFDVDCYGTERTSRHRIADNFTAFRRLLSRFVRAVETGEPGIPPEATLDVVRTLIAGRRSREEGRRVAVEEVGA